MSEPGSLRDRVLVAVYERSHSQLTETDGLVEQLGVSRAEFSAACDDLQQLGLAEPQFHFAPEGRFPGLIKLTRAGFSRAEQLRA
ncbi:hypothetical protein [Streptacidiphilus sp. MAP5-3]|uniref:hypothetical protein n=1 Tax=unclassified Streptacidiphilus TaxID=2643834 RepID=UPI00351670B4